MSRWIAVEFVTHHDAYGDEEIHYLKESHTRELIRRIVSESGEDKLLTIKLHPWIKREVDWKDTPWYQMRPSAERWVRHCEVGE